MSELTNKEKNWGALAHLSLYVVWLLPFILFIIYFTSSPQSQFMLMIDNSNPIVLAVPFVLLYVLMQFVPPFVVLLSQGNSSAFVGHHARESLNFLISSWVAYIVCALLGMAVLAIVTSGGKDLMAILAIAIALVAVVILFYVIFWPIVAATKASKGELYRYRFAIRFI